jgi:hypothetical protein
VKNPEEKMPAKKIASLLSQHDAKAARMQRSLNEAALDPKMELTLTAPGRLKSCKGAGAKWKQMIKMYRRLDAAIVSGLDQDLIVDVCILDTQLEEMDQMRAAAVKNYANAQKILDRKAAKDEIDPKVLIKWQDSLNSAEGMIVKIDARVDRKRALLLSLYQSLYLTPRSRAGVVPPEKPPEKEKTDMEKFLDG